MVKVIKMEGVVLFMVDTFVSIAGVHAVARRTWIRARPIWQRLCQHPTCTRNANFPGIYGDLRYFKTG